MATDGSERSLLPPEGASQPFTWAAERVAPVLQELHARIDRIAASPLPPESLSSLRYWFRTQHVFHSNAIEGSTLTLYETKVVIEDGLTVGGKPLRDVLAAKNLAEALDWVEALSTGAEPLSSSLIRQLHALVVRGEASAFPGEYKRSENIVSGAIHRPPLRFQTAQLMDSLGAYLTSAKSTEDAIIESAIAHAWLVGIHPFQDGNGRTTRLLSNLVLRRRHSHFALLRTDQRAEYYRSLDEAHCTGDLTNFILLWCSCIAEVLQEYERLLGDQGVREKTVEYLVQKVTSKPEDFGVEVLRWRDAVNELARATELILKDLNARLNADFSVKVEPVTAVMLTRAKSHAQLALHISGHLLDEWGSLSLSVGKRPRHEGVFSLGTGMITREGRLSEIFPREGRFDLVVGKRADVLGQSATQVAAKLVELFFEKADFPPAPEGAG